MLTRPLSPREFEALLEQLPRQRDRTLWILGSYTGFRISELLSLELRDVYRSGQVLDFVAVNRRSMKGKRAGRVVALNPGVRAPLLDWVRELRQLEDLPTTPLFPALSRGTRPLRPMRPDTFRHIVRAARERAGLHRVSTHSMRKTFARAVYDATGKDVRATQLALGHESISSTAHYLATLTDEINNTIRALSLGNTGGFRHEQSELWGG